MFRIPAAMLALLGVMTQNAIVAQNHAVAQNLGAAPRKTAIAIRMDAPALPLPLASINSASVTPSTISFTATDPDLGSFSGSSPATVSWNTNAGNSHSTWTLSVASSAANFTSCSTVPASAVRVSCGSVSGGTSGQCGAGFQLGATSRQIASGIEGNGNGNQSYAVTITFTLADSWRYVAEQSPLCTLTLSYTIDAP